MQNFCPPTLSASLRRRGNLISQMLFVLAPKIAPWKQFSRFVPISSSSPTCSKVWLLSRSEKPLLPFVSNNQRKHLLVWVDQSLSLFACRSSFRTSVCTSDQMFFFFQGGLKGLLISSHLLRCFHREAALGRDQDSSLSWPFLKISF